VVLDGVVALALRHRPGGEVRAAGAAAPAASYGWGMIPVAAQIGATGWRTSLFPKDGRYGLPVKDWVRKAEGVEIGDVVSVRLTVDV
jgi:hypothetical protein